MDGVTGWDRTDVGSCVVGPFVYFAAIIIRNNIFIRWGTGDSLHISKLQIALR